MSKLSQLLSRIHVPSRVSLYYTKEYLINTGLWLPDRPLTKAIFLNICLTLSLSYFISILLKLVFQFTFTGFIEFIQYSTFHLALHKGFALIFKHKQWEEVIQLMYELERESTIEAHSQHAQVVYKFRKYCHYCTHAYFFAYIPVGILFILSFWITNALVMVEFKNNDEEMGQIQLNNVFYSLVPFEENGVIGWIGSVLTQSLYGMCCIASAMAWDPLMLTSAVFFSGQLSALRARCVHALDDVGDEKRRWEKIVKCHQHHIRILEASDKFNTLISPHTFLNVLQTSFVCAVCIIKIVLIKSSTTELIRTIDLLIGQYFQLGLFYIIGDEVIARSSALSYGLFESKWVGASVRVRSALLILSAGMQKRVVFSAGPFSEMSLSTLVTILKGSYSFYTLLSHSSNK